MPVFKAYGLAQAFISDCVTETFSAIRTVSFLKLLTTHFSTIFWSDYFFISHRSQPLHLEKCGLRICIHFMIDM